jgi:hypothetical protein
VASKEFQWNSFPLKNPLKKSFLQTIHIISLRILTNGKVNDA